MGGWEAVGTLRRGREAYRSDERILGGPAFGATLLEAVEAGPSPGRAAWRVTQDTLIATVPSTRTSPRPVP